MLAAVLRGHELVVDEVPDPVPPRGHVLVETIANGICGTDLHLLDHAEEWRAVSIETGLELLAFDSQRDVVLGHELSGRVLELGPGTDGAGLHVGDLVVGTGMVSDADGAGAIGFSNDWPGGFGERVVVSVGGCLPIPDGLDPRLAALTEPMSVGLGSVVRSGIQPGDAAVVYGCGPIGLAIIGALVARDIEPVIASDLLPNRRAVASAMGAHVVVDPTDEPPMDACRRVAATQPVVLFEAVGVPGMIERVLGDAPFFGRVVVTGACMQHDSFRPMVGINKSLNVQFSGGYTPEQLGDTLRAIADGRMNVEPLITGEIGIAAVPSVFEALKDPRDHVKVLIEPALP